MYHIGSKISRGRPAAKHSEGIKAETHPYEECSVFCTGLNHQSVDLIIQLNYMDIHGLWEKRFGTNHEVGVVRE